MSNSEFSVSRERYYAVCGALVIVAIALLIAVFSLLENGKTGQDGPVDEPPVVWLQTDEKFPVDENLKNFLVDKKIHSTIYITEPGQVFWTGVDGNPVKPCGKLVGTQIVGCKLDNVSIKTITKILFLGITGSPSCKLGNIDGAIGAVHSTNTPRGHYGTHPCP